MSLTVWIKCMDVLLPLFLGSAEGLLVLLQVTGQELLKRLICNM